MSNVLEDAFRCLEFATEREDKGDRVEAATKYYEGCYLLKRYLERLPISLDQNESKSLVFKKVQHYEKKAHILLREESPHPSSENSRQNSRSVDIRHSLLAKETSVVPMAIAVPIPSTTLSSLRHSTLFNSVTKLITIKAGMANSHLAQALDLDESSKREDATGQYMLAAELYLEAIKVADKAGPGMLSTLFVLKNRLEGALDRIEQIKDPHKTKLPNIQKIEREKEKESLKLSKEEITILQRSSLISSGLFLPWSEQEAKELSRNALRPSKSLFIDLDGPLKLSESQKKQFYKWARPAEILAIRGMSPRTLVMIKNITPYTIRQKCVTDCSMIASLCVCSVYERRFKKQLITAILYPKNSEGIPIINPNGKYFVRLWLNGVARCIVVDDFFPIDNRGNLLCSHTTSTGLELWVSVIEKAYMKLCGGYDFPGSNSGVDLFALTGWIPERLFFPQDPNKIKDHETASSRAWERLYGASSYGDCLISVSSSPNLTKQEAERVGLITGHAYAVLRVVQTKNGTRLLQLKNPWARKSWQGRFSSADIAGWKDQNLRHEVGYNQEVARNHDDGVFWISWNDILTYFQTLHLSWNSNLFNHQSISHSFWPASQGPQVDTFNISENPQYILKFSSQAIKNKASIWVLLSRHVDKQEQEGCEVKEYLAIHLYRNEGGCEKIFYPGESNCILRGAYTNNPHILMRYDLVKESDENLSLVLSQYQKTNDIGYTLSCYCNEPFKISKPVNDLPYNIEIYSKWTNSGGSPNHKTFGRNPMFAVEIPTGGSLIQLRISAMQSTAANIMLVKVGKLGQKISELKEDPIIDSGHYRFGYVTTGVETVHAGQYTLIASTFTPGQQSNFYIQIFSSIKLITVSKTAL